MKRHPAAGAEILRAGGADPEVQDIALHHQEKIDGTGYPDRLAGQCHLAAGPHVRRLRCL